MGVELPRAGSVQVDERRGLAVALTIVARVELGRERGAEVDGAGLSA
jgi:hypothetical protein